MKKLMLILSFVMVLGVMLFAQTTTIDFELEGDGYTPSETGGSGTTDLFNRVNPDIGGNASYIWAMEDYNNSPSLTLDQIDITGAETFTFSVDFLTPNSNDWDNTDELLITYSVDGGAYQNLMWIQSVQDATSYNDPAALDLAFDGDGDAGQELPAIVDDYPAGVGGDFVTFSAVDIVVSGSTLDILLQFNGLTSTAEGIYLDNIEITPVLAGGVTNPSGFTATTVSVSQIDLAWALNANSDNVMVAWSADGIFGTPVDGTSYAATDAIAGGGTVLYNGSALAFNHTALTAETQYYYKAWSADGSDNYSTGTSDNATTLTEEATNHVSDFAAVASAWNTIDLTWTENLRVEPDGYLIKASTSDNVSAPVDGTEIADNLTIGDDDGAVNLAVGTSSYAWADLDASTAYYFEIYPYTNSGAAIDYKTDGMIPGANAATPVLPDAPAVFFSEYIEGGSNNKAIEIFNGTGGSIDLSDFEVRLAGNGGAWGNTAAPTGMLADGEVFVIYNSGSVQAIIDEGDLVSTVTYYNGNDALGLFYSGLLIDVLGEQGVDSYWSVAGVSSGMQNKTLVRKSSVTEGTTDWTTAAGTDEIDSEWIVYAQDTFDYLGSHTMGGNSLPLINNIARTPAGDILSTDTVSISADVTDLDGSIVTSSLLWGTDGVTFPNTIIMSVSVGDTWVTDTDIPAQANGTTVSFYVQAFDNQFGYTDSAVNDYFVVSPQSTTLPYAEPFDTDLGICYANSVLGDTKYWLHGSASGNGYARMNGFNSGETEEDWLVLPAVDFDSYTSEVMTFDTWYNYGTEGPDDYMKLYYSVDYTGLGDPTGATWVELTYTPPASSSTWSGSGDIDLSGITGSAVYIAFKYHYNAGVYRSWEVDNILIDEGVEAAVTVTAPNGGESWQRNNSYDITWDTALFTGDAEVAIYYNDGGAGGQITPYVLNTGSYTWDIPVDMPLADNYTIEINVYEGMVGDVTDTSDAVFSIIAEQAVPDIIINEVDADQAGTDADEFIELYDGGVGNQSLDGFVVVLFNGSDDSSYNTAIDLDGYTTDVDGYFVIGSATVPNVDYAFFTTNGLQNGADAVALFHGYDDTDFPNDTPVTAVNLIDAIVYDTNDTDDAGLLPILLNPAEPQVNEAERGDSSADSNQRIPNGTGGAMNTSTYAQSPPTPGAANVYVANMTAPINITIVYGTNVTVTWDEVTGAAGYTVYFSTDPYAADPWTEATGTFDLLTDPALPTWTETATTGAKNFYKVTAHD
jgi:hypothetical protein